ncbi:hypothetical protein [Sphingomonas sp. NPDC079357]|uniref:hypothetical protein n=1 Tax=Sphingomonas sp. NPDC079357 TaxID=3364518 RepID=UPI00384F48F7
MEVRSARVTVEDDVTAALRRAVGFAGLFGLTALAAVACTARSSQPASGITTDRLIAQEALWQAEVSGAPTIALPPALVARRADPKVAAVLADVQHQLAADRTAAAARRNMVLQRMTVVRADRDLRESQRAVLSLKIDQAYERAQQRGTGGNSDPLQHELAQLKVQMAKVNGDAAMANRQLNTLNDRMMALANAEHARAAQHLSAVRDQLRGG